MFFLNIEKNLFFFIPLKENFKKLPGETVNVPLVYINNENKT